MKINATPKTPSILFDSSSSLLEIKGISCPENPVHFYNPLLHELQQQLNDKSKLHILIHLDYFNTGSSKCLLNLFNLVAERLSEKENAQVTWVTETEDFELIEAGKIFQEMSGLPFIFEQSEPEE